MLTNRHLLLHLSLIPTIGPAAVNHIIAGCFPGAALVSTGRELAHLYALTVADYCRVGLTVRMAEAVVDGLKSPALLEQELALIERHGIGFATIMDEHYPSLLKNIYLPPTVLYWRGASLPEPALRLAVVGSRKANRYAAQVIELLLPSLIVSGIEIVSGGALGVDTMAHTITVQAGGVTRVVLGSGLLNRYPLQNERLFATISEQGGSLVSSFPLMADPVPGNFPARNRIIAGLSQGTLIIQAPNKSGALITAQYALEQGRQVFAVPGALTDPLNEGCHRLIQQGAALVASAENIAHELGLAAIELKPAASITLEKKEVQIPTAEHPLLIHLREPQGLDELVVLSGVEPDLLYDQLFTLQVQGKVKQTYTGQWLRA